MSATTALTLVVLLIVANGLFVAAEFSLVSVRRAELQPGIERGERRSRIVARELDDVSTALSVQQFGITATSLLVGWLVDQSVGSDVVQPLLVRVGLPAESTLVFAVGIAFFLSTVTQMVVGELFPKNLAIAKPLVVVRAVSPFSRGFGVLFGPVIRVFDVAARVVTTRVFGVEVRDQLDSALNLTELARVIRASGEQGNLSAGQATLLTKATALGDRRVSEVMVPRPDIHWLHVDATLEDLRRASDLTGHSRFPVYRADENDVLGTVHIKSLLSTPRAAYPTTTIHASLTPVLTVPESVLLRRLLADFARSQRTAAIVIDEFGTTAGIVTIEDVVEELVGEIEDEFDPYETSVRRIGPNRFRLPGSFSIEQCAALLHVSIPDGPYETLAGFVLDHLGRIPAAGESVTVSGGTITVHNVDQVRITELDVLLSQPPAERDL